MPGAPPPWDDVLRGVMRPLDDAVERMSTPRMRFEFRRKTFHVAGAVLAVPAMVFLPFVWALLFGAVVVAVIVIAYFVRERRLKVQGLEALTDPVGAVIQETRREGERFPWAPVSFTLALMAVGAAVQLLRLPVPYALAAFGILGFGDAASALVGIAFGQHKLPWNRRKSWEGTFAGVVVAAAAAIALASFWYAWQGQVLPAAMFLVFGGAALIGGLVESVPGQQDNWTVPVGSLLTMIVAGRLLGV